MCERERVRLEGWVYKSCHLRHAWKKSTSTVEALVLVLEIKRRKRTGRLIWQEKKLALNAGACIIQEKGKGGGRK